MSHYCTSPSLHNWRLVDQKICLSIMKKKIPKFQNKRSEQIYWKKDSPPFESHLPKDVDEDLCRYICKSIQYKHSANLPLNKLIRFSIFSSPKYFFILSFFPSLMTWTVELLQSTPLMSITCNVTQMCLTFSHWFEKALTQNLIYC